MSKPTFEQRCLIAEQCLPDAPYRDMLKKLHTEMLEALAEQPAPVQWPVAFITPLMEQQMFDDWCPYKGNPDPRVVWAAAVDAVNGLLLGAAPHPAPGVYLIKEGSLDEHALYKVFDGQNWYFGAADISGALQVAWNGGAGREFDLRGPRTQPIRAAILSKQDAKKLVKIVSLARKYIPQPAPVHPDSSRIDWLTNNPVDALDIFGHVKGADAVRWIRQEIDNAIASKEEGK